MIETTITRLLDASGVFYRRLEHSEPVYTIETAAAQRGAVRSEMIKSILLRESCGQRRHQEGDTLCPDETIPALAAAARSTKSVVSRRMKRLGRPS